MCCTRLAGNAGPKKSPKKIHHLGTIAQICLAISSQLKHISTIGKKLLNSNISPTRCPNTVNLGPLTAEIRSGVWGTSANFNGFRLLAALLHGRTQNDFITAASQYMYNHCTLHSSTLVGTNTHSHFNSHFQVHLP